MTVKTDYSRFDIHDELTAPDGSARILKSISTAGGTVSKFVGVLAGAPAALRAYTRMRSELRAGALPEPTRERIALAVAERRGDGYSIAQHATRRAAAGTRARRDLARPQLRVRRPSARRRCSPSSRRRWTAEGRPAHHLLEEARESAGPTSRSSRRSRKLALNEFQSLIANAAALPQDQTRRADPDDRLSRPRRRSSLRALGA